MDSVDHYARFLHSCVHPSAAVSPSLSQATAFHTSLDEGRFTTMHTADDPRYYGDHHDDEPWTRLTRTFHLRLADPSRVPTHRDTFNDDMDHTRYPSESGDIGQDTQVERTVHASLMLTKANTVDAQKTRPYLGYWPLEVVRHTLELTT